MHTFETLVNSIRWDKALDGAGLERQRKDAFEEFLADRQESRIRQEVPDQLAAYLQVHDLIEQKEQERMSGKKEWSFEDTFLAVATTKAQLVTLQNFGSDGTNKTPRDIIESADKAFNDLVEEQKPIKKWMVQTEAQASRVFNALSTLPIPDSLSSDTSTLVRDYADSFFHASMTVRVAMQHRLGDLTFPYNWGERPYSRLLRNSNL